MPDLIDVIHQEISRALARSPGIKAATVSSYDPDRHAIKAKVQPDGFETGWFPIGTQHIGNGFGIVSGPQIGDQIVVGFLGGDPESPVHLGRIHSDQERPPKANAGELVMRDHNGTQIKFDDSGVTTTVGGTTWIMALDGSVSLNSGGKTISITGPIEASGGLAVTNGPMTHNGVDVGADHTHTNVEPGAGISGPPTA